MAGAQNIPILDTAIPDATTRIERLCADHGVRLTGQRRLIARILSAAVDHPDIEEVFRRASAIEPGIALSTVYRTIRLFEDHGLLERHAFGDGHQARARIEPVSGQHHDHLINVETGEVIEFCSAEIEALQERIATELGFDLVGHRLQLYGTPTKRTPGRRRDGNE